MILADETAWTAFAAVAAAASAVATVVMAYATFRVVSATKDEVGAATRMVDAANQQVAQMVVQAAASTDQAEASLRLAELGQRQLESTVRGLLVNVPRGERLFPEGRRLPHLSRAFYLGDQGDILVDAERSRLHVNLPVRNLGPGVVLVTSVGLHGDRAGPTAVGHADRPAIAAGDVARLDIPIRAHEGLVDALAPALEKGPFFVTITYTGLGAANPARSRLRLERRVDGFAVVGLELFDGDAQTPHSVAEI